MKVTFTATLVCSDGCQRYFGKQKDAKEAQKFFNGQVDTIRKARRTKLNVEVKYQGSTVTLYYFSGVKHVVTEVCQARTVGSIRDKMSLCGECSYSALCCGVNTLWSYI